ncbi:octopamine receptor Oamb-like [Asterias rubens]|uniref:octopamine receptor Oamb-like n=1 Tax=Asterias rubens TaxID=7604 RepID=UPI0014551A53|nr:octopamine receptor Oamb-like [Asterias rubens]
MGSMALYDNSFFMAGGNDSWPSEEGQDPPPAVENLISVVLWLLCAVIVIGNILVISAFVRDRELRVKPANLFILNLSISDLMVGLISISFYNIWERHTESWIFGEVVCKLWTIVDYTATTQSAMAIVLISFDRVMLVSKGLKYREYITLRLTLFLIVSSWIWSFSLNSIPILFSDTVTVQWVDYGLSCDFGILYQFVYKMTAIIFSFVIPFVCLAIFNIIVYNNIRARSRGVYSSHSNTARRTEGAPVRCNSQGRGTSEYKKHRKAAITLALIVGVFLTCWLPWSVNKLVSLIAIYTEESFITDALAYLLWSNSAINPFLYAVTHPRIRTGLIACLLCCVPAKFRPRRVRGGFQNTDYNQMTGRSRARCGTGTTITAPGSDTRNNDCSKRGSSV